MNNSKKKKFLFLIFVNIFSISFISNYIFTDLSLKSSIYDNNDEIVLSKPIISPLSLDFDQKVILQAYFWEVPDTGTWWNVVANEISEIGNMGIDALWLPPMSKTETGNIARCGYEPYDYYDLGEFNQKGSIETRYGSRNELESLINAAHQSYIKAIADIIINHNNGGSLEENPYVDLYGINPYPGDLGNLTPTNFMNVSSGRFPRNYTHFHPCAYEISDNAKFGYYPDLCHKNPEVQSELIKWGKWLNEEIGYDAWRFDMALGVMPEMFNYWMENISNTWGVIEYWTGSNMELQPQLDYLDSTNNTVSSFDFILTYEFHDMAVLNGSYDMRNLESAGLLGSRPDQAVTFVVNHDTWREFDIVVPEEDRLLAYSYILTHEGYPMIYWEDLFNLQMHHELNSLIQIHNQLAKGSTEVLYTDSDLYIMQRNGDPGLILIMNDNPSEKKSITVQSKYRDTTLHDLMGRMDDVNVDSSGNVELSCLPLNYAIYSTEDPVYTLGSMELDENNTISVVPENNIIIDGRFDKDWGAPKKIDPKGDSGKSIQDLSQLYVVTDEKNLYVGFEVNKYEWKGENLDYGIAFDTKIGGNRSDPTEHSLITWAGNNEPDAICYISTNHEIDNRIVQSGKLFEVNEHGAWNLSMDLTKDEDFATNIAYNFIEVKIPLEKLDLEQGGSFRLKVFTSPAGNHGAVDTIPQDAQVDPEGLTQTWISLGSDTEFVLMPIESTNNEQSDGNKRISGYIELTTILILNTAFYLIYIIYKRKK